MLPEEISNHLIQYSNTVFGMPISIFKTNSIRGGSVNQAVSIYTNNGTYFIKYNNTGTAVNVFEAEANGLETLDNTNTFVVPKSIYVGNTESYDFIVMTYLDEGILKKDFWSEFGRELGRLHKNTNDNFGFEINNFIGSLSQNNSFKSNWTEFFIENRLTPQLKMLADSTLLDAASLSVFDSLFTKLENLIPTEKPSLLHGDLWSGNMMIGPGGQPTVFDPAVYFGHREIDIAMTKLFGGFDDEMYAAYHEYLPLEKNWESRVALFELYPLLVHANLFGGNYLAQSLQIAKRYI